MEGNTPLVSVVTISYNSEATIRHTIESVIKQTYKNIQYVIVDGLSNDRTLDVIKEYEDHVDTLVSEKDHGIYDAFNKGIRLCKGEFVQIVNSDDFLDANKIKICVEYMLKNPSVDILHGDLRMFKNDYQEYYEHRKGKNPSFINQFHMGAILHPTFFVKRSIYDQLLFREYKIGMDFDWTLRAINKGHVFEVCHDSITYMKDDGHSNVDFKKSMKEDYKIAVDNGVNKSMAFLFLQYSINKKRIFNLTKSILPLKILYLFKPNKQYQKK